MTQKKENVFIEENQEENTKLVEKFSRKKTLVTTVKLASNEDLKEKSPKKFSLFTPFLEKLMTQNQEKKFHFYCGHKYDKNAKKTKANECGGNYKARLNRWGTKFGR